MPQDKPLRFNLIRDRSEEYYNGRDWILFYRGERIGSFCPTVLKVLRNKSQKGQRVPAYDVTVSYKNNGGIGIRLWYTKEGQFRVSRLGKTRGIMVFWHTEEGLRQMFKVTHERPVTIYVRLKAVKKKRKAARAA